MHQQIDNILNRAERYWIYQRNSKYRLTRVALSLLYRRYGGVLAERRTYWELANKVEIFTLSDDPLYVGRDGELWIRKRGEGYLGGFRCNFKVRDKYSVLRLMDKVRDILLGLARV